MYELAANGVKMAKMPNILRPALLAGAVSLVTAGCGAGAGVTMSPATPASAARPPKGALPLEYYFSIRNELANALRFTLKTGKDVTYEGPSSFELEPNKITHVRFTISTFAPGPLLTIGTTGAKASQTLRQGFSIVGSGLRYAMQLHCGSGVNLFVALIRSDSTSAKVVIRVRPVSSSVRQRRRALDWGAAYKFRVTLDDALKAEAFDASVAPGKAATLQGPSSFGLAPGASRTVVSSEPVSHAGLVERIRMRDAATGQEQATSSLSGVWSSSVAGASRADGDGRSGTISYQFDDVDAHGATIREQAASLEAEHQAIVRDVLSADCAPYLCR